MKAGSTQPGQTALQSPRSNPPHEPASDFQASVAHIAGAGTSCLKFCSVHDLLRSADVESFVNGNPLALSDEEQKNTLRWIHLPVNNMEWILCVMEKISFPVDMASFDRFWLRQERRVRANGLSMMDSLCHYFQESGPSYHPQGHKGYMLYMPFMRSESYETYSGIREQSISSTNPTDRSGSMGSLKKIMVDYTASKSAGSATQPLHIPTSIDQFLDLSHEENPSAYDRDQFVYRRNVASGRGPMDILVVDQLWLWTDGRTVISSCSDAMSRGNGLSTEGDDGALASILRVLRNDKREKIDIANDLAVGSTDECAIDIFRAGVRHAADRYLLLHEEWSRLSDLLETTKRVALRTSLDPKLIHLISILNTRPEVELMAELDDLGLELQSIRAVLAEQTQVIQDLAKAIAVRGSNSIEERNDIYDQWYRRIHSSVSRSSRQISSIDSQVRKLEEKLKNLAALKDTGRTRQEAFLSLSQSMAANKQGQAVLAFTVLNMIFLPLSFMTAFFAIPMDHPPYELSLGYVVKYLVIFTASVFVPSFLIAFNTDRISKWAFWPFHQLRLQLVAGKHHIQNLGYLSKVLAAKVPVARGA